MTIRELLVRIGFATDKTSMQSAQTEINRLRTSLEGTGEKGQRAGQQAAQGLRQIGNVASAETGLRGIQQNLQKVEEGARRAGEQGARNLRRIGEVAGAGVGVKRLQQELQRVEDISRRAGQQGERSMRQIGESAQEAGGKIKKMNDAASSVSRDTVVAGAAMTAPMAGSVVAAANFEYAMKRVQAVTNSTDAQYQELSAEAERLGASTQFSASEAADGMYYLGLAGWKTGQIIKAMPGMLDLAAAGDLNLAQTADIVSDTMQAFGIDAAQAGHVSDVFAATITNTNTDIQKLGDTMKYIAPIAHQAGLSIEETSAMAGLMANEAVKATMSGTSLRGGLLRLAGPPKMAADALEKLGVNTKDAAGNMKRPLQLIQEISQAMQGMGNGDKLAYLKKIFGEEAATGWATLLDQGPEKLDALTKSLENADGAAARIRDIKMDSLMGQWIIFKSAVEGAAISVGKKLLPSLQGFVSKAGVMMSDFKAWVDANPELAQGIIMIISGLGILLTVLGSLGVILTSVVGFFFSLSAIWTAIGPMVTAVGSAIAGALGLATAPAWAVVAAIVAIGYAIYDLYQWMNGGNSIFAEWFGPWENFKAQAAEFLKPLITSFDMIIEAAKTLWRQLTEAFSGSGSKVGEFIQALKPVAQFIGIVIGGALYIVIRFVVWLIEEFMALMTAGGYVADAIATFFNGAIQLLTDIVKFFCQLFVGDISGAIDTVIDFFGTLLLSILKILYDIVAAVITYICNGFVQNFGSAIERVKQFFADLLKSALDTLSEIGSAISKYVTDKIGWAKGAISSLFSFSNDAAAAAVDNSRMVYNTQKNTFNIRGSDDVTAAVAGTNTFFDSDFINSD